MLTHWHTSLAHSQFSAIFIPAKKKPGPQQTHSINQANLTLTIFFADTVGALVLLQVRFNCMLCTVYWSHRPKVTHCPMDKMYESAVTFWRGTTQLHAKLQMSGSILTSGQEKPGLDVPCMRLLTNLVK